MKMSNSILKIVLNGYMHLMECYARRASGDIIDYDRLGFADTPSWIDRYVVVLICRCPNTVGWLEVVFVKIVGDYQCEKILD